MTPDLFPEIFEGLTRLPGFAAGAEAKLFAAVQSIAAAAPFRQMVTPWGKPMSVGMTNCGAAGWITDRSGYRYTPTDPQTGQPWPRHAGNFPRSWRKKPPRKAASKTSRPTPA